MSWFLSQTNRFLPLHGLASVNISACVTEELLSEIHTFYGLLNENCNKHY